LEPLTEQTFFDAFLIEIVAFCPLVSLIPTSERITFEVRNLPLAMVGIVIVGVEAVTDKVGGAGELALANFTEILGDENVNSSAQILNQVPSSATEV
jgi:hypothetical protein